MAGSKKEELAPPQQSATSVQQSQAQQLGPDLSNLSPKLQQEWDKGKNAHLGIAVITKKSNISVAWRCNHCPDGFPHEWTQSPKRRAANDGCPFCTGRRVCKHNSLATRSPIVAASWDYQANKGTPNDYTAGSGHRASWICVVCGGSWEAVIRKRALRGTGCPDCYALRRGRKADGSRTSHPTLRAESGDHPLMSEWDTDANEEDGLRPDKIKLRSHKHVNWVCHKCPMGHLHLYKAKPLYRTVTGSGCPYCAGQKVCKCNSLQTWCPGLAEQWDFLKNRATPEDYTAGSRQLVWWKTAKRGSWQARIYVKSRLHLLRLSALKQ